MLSLKRILKIKFIRVFDRYDIYLGIWFYGFKINLCFNSNFKLSKQQNKKYKRLINL